MKAIFFDVETLGLPVWDKPSEDPCQPRVIQLACEMALIDGQSEGSIASLDVIIRPDGWTIPAEITALTGITQEMAMDVGVPINNALNTFIDLWMVSDMRVAHNESFDARMIRIELMRHPVFGGMILKDDAAPDGQITFADRFKAGAAYCTMRNAQKVMGVKKSPKLAEAYEHFAGETLMGAHNAAVDVMACKAIYMALKRRESDAGAGAAPVTIFADSPAQTKVNKADLWPGAQ
jgi:DNA polymerase-3 subunit epsilon